MTHDARRYARTASRDTNTQLQRQHHSMTRTRAVLEHLHSPTSHRPNTYRRNPGLHSSLLEDGEGSTPPRRARGRAQRLARGRGPDPLPRRLTTTNTAWRRLGLAHARVAPLIPPSAPFISHSHCRVPPPPACAGHPSLPSLPSPSAAARPRTGHNPAAQSGEHLEAFAGESADEGEPLLVPLKYARRRQAEERRQRRRQRGRPPPAGLRTAARHGP